VGEHNNGMREWGIPRRVQSKYVRQDPLRVAQELWHLSKIPRNFKVPDWYCLMYGTSPWLLTRPASGLSEARKAMAFIIRLNYLTDTTLLRGGDPTSSVLPRVPRAFSVRLRFLRRPLMDTISGSRLLCWGHSPSFNWRGVLSCTLRRYVDLAFPALGPRCPDSFLSRLRSA
jgi:hypothetical protein